MTLGCDLDFAGKVAEFLNGMKIATILDKHKYGDARCIPPEIACHEVYARWFRHAIMTYLVKPADAWAQIPQEHVTDELRWMAIKFMPTVLKAMSPSDTPAYQDMMLKAIARDVHAFEMMDESFKTAEFLTVIANECPDAIDLRRDGHRWVLEFLTAEIRDKLLESNVIFALWLPEAQVTWDQWVNLLKTQHRCIDFLEEDGRVADLFGRFLKEGHWVDESYPLELSRPSDLSESIALLENSTSIYSPYLVYRAKVRTFPVEDVVSAMQSAPQIRLLLDLYPEQVLRQHIKRNRAMAGMLIENDLGM
jgi:hypothetical protein